MVLPITLNTSKQKTSESLMLAYAAGDALAFTQLYNLHKAPLFRYLLRQGFPSSRADELFQEIWLKVINSRQRYQQTAKFQTWLYTIARNHLIDEYRRKGIDEFTEYVDELTEDQSNDSTETIIDKERSKTDIINHVRRLPFEQRQAFLLKYDAGMNNEDIANITGTNQETAKSRVRYALNYIRKQMGGGS